MRSRIILSLADTGSVTETARKTNTSPGTIRLWRARFLANGPAALLRDAAGRGRRPALDVSVRRQLQISDPQFAGLSTRELAALLGVSCSNGESLVQA